MEVEKKMNFRKRERLDALVVVGFFFGKEQSKEGANVLKREFVDDARAREHEERKPRVSVALQAENEEEIVLLNVEKRG